MARKEFDLGNAVLFIDPDKSVNTGNVRFGKSNRSVTLYVKKGFEGDLFVNRKVASVQPVANKARGDVFAIDSVVVHMRSVTLYSTTISSLDAAIDVATDFCNAFNERYSQIMQAQAKASAQS